MDLFRLLGIGLMAARKQILANFARAVGCWQALKFLAEAGESDSAAHGVIPYLVTPAAGVFIKPECGDHPCSLERA